MTILQALILGIIEGLTEFLPISSTAHLILGAKILQLPSSEFLKTFEISIQLGAILAVAILYWRRIWNNLGLIWKLAAAFLPTALIGLLLYKLIKGYLLDNTTIIGIALLVGGLIIIWFEKKLGKTQGVSDANAGELENISYKQAFLLGTVQSLAVVPGVSRAGATIIGGLALKIKRRAIVEFSFLLAIPTMAAATLLDLYKTPLNFSPEEIRAWITGFIVSFVTAIIGVKFFIRFVQKHNFIPFAWYRIILGAAILITIYLR